MASGWSRDGSVEQQINLGIEDAVRRIRSKLAVGKSALICDECDRVIPDNRRKAITGVRLCIACQSAIEKRNSHSGGVYRRGNS